MLIFREFNTVDYLEILDKMRAFTQTRQVGCANECWFLEHNPVYTLGQSGKMEHIINARAIPVIKTDRGGQVTYHGPGQLIVYCLIDLRQLGIGIRSFVCRLEKILIELLASYAIDAHTKAGAPGVYVMDKKIASLGLRVKNSCTYHGIALNVNMDITPFLGINPCGFANLAMTQMADYVPDIKLAELMLRLQSILLTRLD